MSKQLRMLVGVAVFATMALAGMLGVFAFDAAQPVHAGEHSAERSFSETTTDADGNVMATVTVSVMDYGLAGSLTENLPGDFSYEAGSAMFDGEAASDDTVNVDGQAVKFTLFGVDSVPLRTASPRPAAQPVPTVSPGRCGTLT